MTNPEPDPHIVILYGGPADGFCTLNRCPIAVHGVFPTREAAHEYAATLPAGFQPHVLPVDPPMR